MRTHLLRRMELDDIICSYLVAYVYDIVGWRFGVPEVRPRECSPAHISQSIRAGGPWRAIIEERNVVAAPAG